MSGFFRSSPYKKPNILTPPPPDLGMLSRSRRVLVFPKSRCIIYFDLRVPDYSNTQSEASLFFYKVLREFRKGF